MTDLSCNIALHTVWLFLNKLSYFSFIGYFHVLLRCTSNLWKLYSHLHSHSFLFSFLSNSRWFLPIGIGFFQFFPSGKQCVGWCWEWRRTCFSGRFPRNRRRVRLCTDSAFFYFLVVHLYLADITSLSYVIFCFILFRFSFLLLFFL